MRQVIALCLLALALAGDVTPCIAARTASEEIDRAYTKLKLDPKTDRFSQRTLVYVSGDLGRCDDVRGAHSVIAYPAYGNASGFVIVFSALMREWAFLGGELDWIADGSRWSETSQADPRRDVNGGVVTETLVFPISPARLDSLAGCTQIEFRLRGSKRHVSGTFTFKQIAALRKIREAPDSIEEK